jgi:hypothetical protein
MCTRHTEDLQKVLKEHWNREQLIASITQPHNHVWTLPLEFRIHNIVQPGGLKSWLNSTRIEDLRVNVALDIALQSRLI